MIEVSNTIKQEIEKEFNEEKNYHAILAKTKEKTMKKALIKQKLIGAGLFLIFLLGFVIAAALL